MCVFTLATARQCCVFFPGSGIVTHALRPPGNMSGSVVYAPSVCRSHVYLLHKERSVDKRRVLFSALTFDLFFVFVCFYFFLSLVSVADRCCIQLRRVFTKVSLCRNQRDLSALTVTYLSLLFAIGHFRLDKWLQ